MRKRSRRLVFIAFLTLCACAGPAQQIIGKWESEDKRTTYEFRSDGKYDFKAPGPGLVGSFGPYRVEKNRLILTLKLPSSGGQWSDEVSTHEFRVEGDLLTLGGTKFTRVVAGGNDEAVWLFAELSITKHNSEPGEKETDATSLVRATELATAASGWKVVTAAFGEPNDPVHSGGAFPMIDTTAAGPLAQLLAAPKLSDDPNAVVITGKDAAVGPDAAKALATWSAHHAVVDGAVREIREAKWGVVQANLSWKDGDGPPFRASAQLIALPKADGSWEIVALHLFKV